MEEQTNFGQIGIGTKESQSLEAKPVEITGYRVDPVPKEDLKDNQGNVKTTKGHYGNKVVLIAKHPDRDEPLELSKTRYLKADKVTTSGLWFNKDDDGLIPKNSALAETMRKYSVDILDNFTGKTIQTDFDNNYLVVKSY
ncbi:MAG TPA: hypothetical protein VJ912_03800 [Candidatus Nanoarchaeia archaeon]|nr:hypothetical protein [Candidatus Nanoarchaeia archaeon]